MSKKKDTKVKTTKADNPNHKKDFLKLLSKAVQPVSKKK